MKFTTNLAFHSQETRLYENVPYVDVLQSSYGTLTLFGVLFQETFALRLPLETLLQTTIPAQ
jgi:hypothetical protein